MEKSNSGDVGGRIAWIDVLRGLMMLAVVIGHALELGDLKTYIFSFHMPAFFIISGMTFAFNKELDTKRYFAKKAKALLVPYVLLNIYLMPLYYVNVWLGNNPRKAPWKLLVGIILSNNDTKYLIPSKATWFITCLFLTEMLFFAYRKIFKNDIALAIALITTTSLFYSLGFIDEQGGEIWHWEVAFTAVIFYAAGYFFMKNLNAVKAAVADNRLRGILTSLIFFITGFMLCQKNIKISMVNDEYGNGMFFYLSAMFTSFAFVLLIMTVSESKVFLKLSKPIDFIGKTTLPYLALHYPVLKVFRDSIGFFGCEEDSHRVLLGVMVYFGLMPFAWVMNKMLPFRRKTGK